MSCLFRLVLVTLSRPIESRLWPWHGGHVDTRCLGNDSGQLWNEMHSQMMLVLSFDREPGSRFQEYHERVSKLDDVGREDFMAAWEEVKRFTATIAVATPDHPVAQDCWCGVGASVVFQSLPQRPTQVIEADAYKRGIFYPPLALCMVMSLSGDTCGSWPLQLIMYRLSEHIEPFVMQCILPVELVNQAPGTIAFRLLKKLSACTDGRDLVDLCVGQALPAALLASKSATIEYVERFTFTFLWWSACLRPTPLANSVYSFMAGRYEVMRMLALRTEKPIPVGEKAGSELPSDYSTVLRHDQHKQLLDLMDVAHAVCEMLGIAYVLNGGGLLGSMRHLSIIPWDDDAEMAIVEEDDRGVEILLLALAMRLESRLELARPEVQSLVETYGLSGEESVGLTSSMLLDRLEAVDRAADFLSKRGVALHIQAQKARTFRISHAAAGEMWSFPSFDFYICSRDNATHWPESQSELSVSVDCRRFSLTSHAHTNCQRVALLLRRGYSRRNGPLYSDSMIFPRRKRYWKRHNSTDGLVLWTFSKPSEYLELLYGDDWFTMCRREEGHADEASRIAKWSWYSGDSYNKVPCAQVAEVVQYTDVSEDQWTAVYEAITAQLGKAWHCQHLVSNPPEASSNGMPEPFCAFA